MKIIAGKLYKKINLVLIFILLLSCCSCSLNNDSKKYLEEKYDDTFTELGNKNHGSYSVSWFESKTYPELYVEVEKDKDPKEYFDNYNLQYIAYNFSNEIKETIKEDISNCFVYTSYDVIIDTNTEFKGIEELHKDKDNSVDVFPYIFIEEDYATKENIYKAAQKLRNNYSNICGTFKFIVVKNNSIKSIKKSIQKYQTLNPGDFYEEILYESKSISLSPNLKIHSYFIFDDYSFPTEQDFWEY